MHSHPLERETGDGTQYVLATCGVSRVAKHEGFECIQRLDDLDDALVTGAPLSPAQTAWVKNQRRSDNLCALQMRLLEALPGWTWSPRDDAWVAHSEELELFLLTSRRSPRIRSEDPGERCLAYWLGRATAADAAGQALPSADGAARITPDCAVEVGVELATGDGFALPTRERGVSGLLATSRARIDLGHLGRAARRYRTAWSFALRTGPVDLSPPRRLEPPLSRRRGTDRARRVRGARS